MPIGTCAVNASIWSASMSSDQLGLRQRRIRLLDPLDQGDMTAPAPLLRPLSHVQKKQGLRRRNGAVFDGLWVPLQEKSNVPFFESGRIERNQ